MLAKKAPLHARKRAHVEVLGPRDQIHIACWCERACVHVCSQACTLLGCMCGIPTMSWQPLDSMCIANLCLWIVLASRKDGSRADSFKSLVFFLLRDLVIAFVLACALVS